jgi:hypothetical protein
MGLRPPPPAKGAFPSLSLHLSCSPLTRAQSS